ncbi:hypothetical protein Pfo_002114 [Paulownia fortunei]|nr:hypothetical protein Pfo_002114 [Paulownia fortunei]
MECSCGNWSQFGIPCSHAMHTCRHFGVNPATLMKSYYSTASYVDTYKGKFEPLPDEVYWDAPHFELWHNPALRIQNRRGRNTTTRIPNEMDWSQTRARQQARARQRVNRNRTTLTVRHAGAPFWSLHGGEGALHPRVVHMLYDMGFYGVYRCGHFDMDFHLITALVERWRPETHTFHFRIGEVTVTLQDVAVIWGLPVDGQPVIGVDSRRSTKQWQEYCHHYLGFRPTSQQFRDGRILLSALRGYLEANPVTDDTPHDELERYARGCALILLGSIMCPDSSGNGVSLLYLQSMEQIKDVVYFSWGSAVLSFMYRELCNASDKDKNVIGGAMVLLQYYSFTRTASHSVRIIRDILDRMTDREISLSIDQLCYRGVLSPRAVMRQFGMRQYIPPDIPAYEHTLHDVDRRGRSGEDWARYHREYVSQWANRHQFIIVNPPITGSDSTEPRYMDWYDGITRRLISPSHLPMEEGFRHDANTVCSAAYMIDSGRGDFTVSPIAFPHLDSDYHDRGESTSVTSSDQSHDIAAAQGGRRGRRQRQRRTCGTSGHF